MNDSSLLHWKKQRKSNNIKIALERLITGRIEDNLNIHDPEKTQFASRLYLDGQNVQNKRAQHQLSQSNVTPTQKFKLYKQWLLTAFTRANWPK